MTQNTADKDRIIGELANLGISPLEQHRKIYKILSNYIAPDENILGAVHGRSAQHWQSLLVATTKRVIYIEADLIFSTEDEVPYVSINGSEVINAPVFIGVILRAKGRTYKLSYANKTQAEQFVEAVKQRVHTAENPKPNNPQPIQNNEPQESIKQQLAEQQDVKVISLSQLSDEIRSYIETHNYILIIDTLRSGDFSTKLARYEVNNSEIYLICHEPIANKVINAVIPDRRNLVVLQIQALFEPQPNTETSDYIYRLVLTDVTTTK